MLAVEAVVLAEDQRHRQKNQPMATAKTSEVEEERRKKRRTNEYHIKWINNRIDAGTTKSSEPTDQRRLKITSPGIPSRT